MRLRPRAALARVLESKALFADGARRHLLPTVADTRQYVAVMRAGFANNPAAITRLRPVLLRFRTLRSVPICEQPN